MVMQEDKNLMLFLSMIHRQGLNDMLKRCSEWQARARGPHHFDGISGDRKEFLWRQHHIRYWQRKVHFKNVFETYSDDEHETVTEKREKSISFFSTPLSDVSRFGNITPTRETSQEKLLGFIRLTDEGISLEQELRHNKYRVSSKT